MSLLQHPLSAAFPSLSADDLAALTRDIETHGLRTPITTHEGMVLDGWHRYSACIEAGVEPVLVELDASTEPRAFVLSLNLSRRHLTASQRASAVAAVSEWRPSGISKAAPGAGLAPTTENLAELAHVSERTVRHAKVAERAGLGEAVRDGKISAKRAAEVAKLPPEERAAAVEAKPKAGDSEEYSEEDDTRQRIADLAADLEALTRIVEADDKLAAAFAEAKQERAAHDRTKALYEAQRVELAEMTRQAKRWMTKAQALEKQVKK